MSSSVERLVDRLHDELGLDFPAGWEFVSLRTGKHQKSAGAWSWVIYRRGEREIGSQYTVGKLLAADRLVVSHERGGDIVIDPVD